MIRLLHGEHLFVVKICLPKSIKDLQGENFSFTIDGNFLKFLAAEKFSKWQWLTRLNFQSFSLGDLDQVQGALCMLRNSPNLKLLRVTHMPMGPEADLELTTSYLESPNCMDQTLFMLQIVEIISLEGARPELLFIKLLLNHSPNLENMSIRPRATSDARKIINIAKDVMLFPRASAKAKMVYLDPKP